MTISPSTQYECVYCGHACTKSAHIDPARDTHSVMAVRADWSINSDVAARRLLVVLDADSDDVSR